MLELYHNTNNYMIEFRHSFLVNLRKKHRLYKKNSVTLPDDLTLHSYKKHVSMIRKYHNHTNSTLRNSHCHKSHKTLRRQSKATSSLFPFKMIAKPLKTKSNSQQNMDTRDHRMGATINNESPEIEPSP